MLFNLAMDPRQNEPLNSPEIEETMKSYIIQLLRESDAPEEIYDLFDL
jgi:hypothetical protein